MNPIILYPSKLYPRALKTTIVLFLVVVVLSWTFPLTILAGIELDGWALGVVLALILHVPLFPLSFFFADVYYHSLRYEIHADEVIVYAGVITKSVKHVPFRTVTNLKVTRGPIERFFGIGSLAIQTAGLSGTTGAEEKLDGMDDVQRVYELIAAELRRFRGSLAPTQADDETEIAVPAAGAGVLIEIRDELRALRADLKRE